MASTKQTVQVPAQVWKRMQGVIIAADDLVDTVSAEAVCDECDAEALRLALKAYWDEVGNWIV